MMRLVVAMMIRIFTLVAGNLGNLRRVPLLLPEFLRQPYAVAGRYRSCEGLGCLFLHKYLGEFFGRCVTQRGVSADGFEQINRVCHVIPLFPLMVIQQV